MGDLHGPAYRVSSLDTASLRSHRREPSSVETEHQRNAEAETVLPWRLLLLGTTLQHLPPGPRLISALYDLASYARARYKRAANFEIDDADGKLLWKSRLRDLGVRVANTLVEMGDWEGCRRHLQSLRVGLGEGLDGREEDEMLRGRIALVAIRIGDLVIAREALGLMKSKKGKPGKEGERRTTEDNSSDVEKSSEDKGEAEEIQEQVEADDDEAIAPTSTYLEALRPLLYLAEGSFPTARDRLTTSLLPSFLAKSNQAVIALYAGQLPEARALLEELVEETKKPSSSRGAEGGMPPTALLFNLATCYELLTDRARALKVGLAERVAQMDGNSIGGWVRAVGDFKL